MATDWNSPSVIGDSQRTIGVDRHHNFGGEFSHGFIDRVIDDFVDQVVQTTRRRITDVHTRSLTDVFHVRQTFQLACAIFGCFLVTHYGLRFLLEI